MDNRFKWVNTEIIYQEKRGNELRWLITKEQICDQQTNTTFSRSILRHPGVAAVMAINEQREVLLIEQFRYTTKTEMWEIPTGTLQGELKGTQVIASELPKLAAERELNEEAGYSAARFELAKRFYVMPGTSDGLVYLFLAFDLSPKKAIADVGEVVTKVKFFPINEALNMIAKGEICDAKTIIGIYEAKEYLDKHL